MKKKHAEDLQLRAAALAADYQTQHITEKTLGILKDADLLKKIATERSRMYAEQSQGWIFEQLEVTKFNLNALKQGSSLMAATTDSMGLTNHDTTDVIITKGMRQIKAYQLKSSNRPSSTAFMLAKEKYSKVELVGPSDQHDQVQRLYKARISSGTLKANDYASAGKRLHRGLEADGVSSGGTKYSESVKSADPKVAHKVASEFKREGVLTEMHQSGLEAGKIGAAISGGFSGVGGLIRLAKGEAGTGEVVAQVAIDAAKGYATSYITTSMSKGVVHVTRAGLETVAGPGCATIVGKAITKSNAHIAIAAGVVQSGKSIIRYLNGEIDNEQLLSEVSHTAITGATAFYYGALGQVIIPVPVVGAFIGSTVGYFIGNMLHQSGLISLGEPAVVKAARERREQVEALCMTAIPLMRENRLELERLLAEHFAERRQLLTSAFDDLESALIAWDPDDFVRGLERVNGAFGAALPFKNFKEFDNFMQDDEQAFIL